MASAKETPRQRMVGMMYLVLTALLALQVSSALIYKFQALNESLEKSSKETGDWNIQKLSRIETEILNRGAKDHEIRLLNNAKLISSRSKETRDYIESIKKQLIQETGGYEKDGSLAGAKEETAVEVMMIGANKNGKAYDLKRKLDEYVKFMNENSERKFTPMALDAKNDPLFMKNDEQKNKDFAELNFGQTPLVASLTVLSEFQSRITTMEATTITALSEKVGIKDIMVDRVRPMVSPVSRVVAAGTKYEAQLFMAATSSNVKPTMVMDANNIDVDDNGVGKISFTTSGGAYNPEGLVKKVWTGKVTMRMPDGKDSTFTVTEEYMVAKPLIQIEAAAVKALYRNCGNKLNIQVPALGNAYNPSISATGATVIPGANKGLVTVVPTGSSVTLKVSSGGNYIGEERYRVKLIPLPAIEIKLNNAPIDPVKGVKKDLLRNITVKAIPDREFYNFLPDDATYKVEEWRVTLAAGTRSRIAPIVIKSQETLDLSLIRNSAVANNRIIIEVLKVKRKNFKGEWEEVSIPAKAEQATITE